MRKNIKLFIAGKEVHCSEGISLPMTYTVEDFQNPTIVKNSFSKTISIPGDKNNNKIFGEIYKLDRLLHIKDGNISGIYFDPSKRVDFQIYNNSYLVESGYMQLNSISINKAVITYNITLYGGLGDFFYGLKYKEDGTNRTLADLRYFVTDIEDNVLPENEEMNFIINKDFVNTCFETSNTGWVGNYIHSFITFMPAYNGLYENFDNETCLINTNGTSLFPKSASDSGNTYTPYNGYALASLNKAYTEWEMRDLRSYMQRPAIKLSKLIETICRKENSGYDVIFDDSFFNSSNPYWDKTFVALPLLGTLLENTETGSDSANLRQTSNGQIGSSTATGDTGSRSNTIVFNAENGGNVINTVTPGFIDFTNIDLFSSEVDITIPFSITADTFTGQVYDELYLSYNRYGNTTFPNGNQIYRSIVVRAELIDVSTNGVTGYSEEVYNFSNSIRGGNGYPSFSSQEYWNTGFVFPAKGAWANVDGTFKKGTGSTYNFTSTTGGNTFVLNIKKARITNTRMAIKIYVSLESKTTADFDKKLLVISNNNNVTENPQSSYYINSFGTFNIDTDKAIITVNTFESSIGTGTLVTKNLLLRTEQTPADYLLSYAKLFGLYFSKDIDSKTIRIYTRNNFFKNNINDWSDRIDYSKDITVNPLLFDKKWYTMALETPETYYANKYDKQYDITYGQQRLDTGYNFNSDNTDLYSDNIYENIVSARDVDKYFRNFYNSNNVAVPAFMNDNITYSLFKVNGSEIDKNDQALYGANYINTSKTVEWYNIAGNDIFPKTCYYSISNDEQSLEEISASIVFFTGVQKCKDVNGNETPFWISDDVPAMATLNEERCFLWTTTDTDINGNKIAIKRTTLPQFIRYYISSSIVTDSLDFGLPKEVYIDNINYTEDTVIYSKFWKKFYNDQFDVNTKKITCYVKMNDLDVKYDLLREFYYFDSSYWVLNKIDSYDINSDATTRCEFIKVQDIDNYLYSISNLGEYINISPNNIEVPYNANTVRLKVSSNLPWEISYYNHYKISKVEPTSADKGDTYVEVTYNENTDYNYYSFYMSFRPTTSNSSIRTTWNCKQLPNPSKTVILSGTIQFANGQIPDYNFYVCASNNTFTNCVYSSIGKGEYSLYVEKGSLFTLEISNDDGDTLYTEQLTLNEDTIKNITI